MPRSGRLSQLTAVFCVFLGLLAPLARKAAAAPNQGTNMGPEDTSKVISVTVWLNLHNKPALDALAQQIYDKGSPNYHQWLTISQFRAQFAPTAQDVTGVREFLASHNLTVTSVGPNNHFVVARGTVADAQQAFNTQINRMMVSGAMHRMNASEPRIEGPAASLVSAVQGLSDLAYRTNVHRAANPVTRQPYDAVAISAGNNGLFFSGQCLRPPQTLSLKSPGGFPAAVYVGNRYGADNSSPAPNLPPCGYDAAQLQAAYGLNPLYKSGLTGAGQTIVIVDAFGSNTILNDANIFSSLNDLPPLTPSNFQIVDSDGPATCTEANGCFAANAQLETTLDVEWAHAIAPGANIVLVLTPDILLSSLDTGNIFAIENGLGNVLSNSFGIPEVVLAELAPSELALENEISEVAASLGIAHNIASGDTGDDLAADNEDFGINSASVDANADSPFATGVGGTSTFLNSQNNIELQTGWGLNVTQLTGATPTSPSVPPMQFGFQEGGGGGASAVYAKPAFQNGLRGKYRLVPDISMNADPQTGVEIIITPDGVLADGTFVAVAGGTSLSCPMFSALWAIANQANAAAGGGSLGQAAPLLYELGRNAITDVNVVPLDTLLDVNGLILNPPAKPLILEPAPALAQPLENTSFFVSALFQGSTSDWFVLTFGTDSSLVTGPGWDNVTGLGTPNGAKFVQGVVAAVHH
ncbi:MAG TPA: protease pro-enzyme activation domain-containing protein [Candidatus Acidoferrum sp.]|nr:protease pro-enzyme activation domain-containing protein [Candidatus Acidoferrum sp.]